MVLMLRAITSQEHGNQPPTQKQSSKSRPDMDTSELKMEEEEASKKY